jgi:hypothetical protein
MGRIRADDTGAAVEIEEERGALTPLFGPVILAPFSDGCPRKKRASLREKRVR